MPASRGLWLSAAALTGLLLVAGPAASALTAEPPGAVAQASRTDAVTASAPGPTSPRAADGWIDGGDDLPCVDDETCLWIEGCKLDGDNNPVYPNHNGTHVGGGAYSYADDPPSSSPSPTAAPSSQPTKSPSAQPTRSPSSQPSTKPSSGSSQGSSQGTNAAGSSSPSSDPTTSESTTEDASESPTEAPVAGASVLAAPVLTVNGSDLTVTWAAPVGERTDLTGYTVKVLAGPAAEADAQTTTHTFTALPDGVYAAQVTARYAEGKPETSPVSEKITLGDDPTKVAGTVTVTGDVVAGERVTVSGTGFAPGTSGFQVELHSDPVVLAAVETDASGAFQVETTVPDDVPAGDHTVVVIFDNVEVGSAPVTVAAPATTTTAAASVGSTTSTNKGGLILLAGLVVGAGVVLAGYGVSKRRRSAESPSATVDQEVQPVTV